MPGFSDGAPTTSCGECETIRHMGHLMSGAARVGRQQGRDG
jgi:hypothetical protein